MTAAVALAWACGGDDEPAGGPDGDVGPPADAGAPSDEDAGQPTHAVTVEVTGDGEGRVESEPEGIDCGEACSAEFVEGRSVALSALAEKGSAFAGWSGDCDGQTCELALAEPKEVVATFDLRPNYAFVTASAFTADLGGLDGADALCQAAADEFDLPGSYVAWLGSTSEGTSARSRLAGARGWVRVDGLPFADTPDALASGEIFYPLRIDESGEDHPGEDAPGPWTGATGFGDASGDDCAGWTAQTEGESLVGDPEAGTRRWTQVAFERGACSEDERPLYCFGTDREVRVSPEAPPDHRVAFLSGEGFSPGGGIAAADALCAERAAAAGISGEFKALLATKDASAASRFDDDGPLWARVDGALLSPSAEAFVAADRWAAALNVTEEGDYLDVSTWGGSEHPAEIGTDTCADWTDEGIDARVGVSSSTRVREAFGDESEPACENLRNRLYCLEE